MLDVSIVNKTSPEANWNGRTDRRKSHVLSQADALTKNCGFKKLRIKYKLRVINILGLKDLQVKNPGKPIFVVSKKI